MQVHRLGSTTLSPNATKSIDQPISKKAFATIYDKMTQKNNQVVNDEVQQEDSVITQLKDLLAFLQTGQTESLSAEDNPSVDAVANSNEDWQNGLNITAEELQALLMQLSQQLNPELFTELQGKTGNEAMTMVLDLLSKQSPDQLLKTLNADTIKFLKGAKQLAIMSSEQQGTLTTDKSAATLEALTKKISDILESVTAKSDQKPVLMKQTFKAVILDPTIRLSPASKEQTVKEATNEQQVTFSTPTVSRPEQLTLTLSTNGKSVSPEQLMKQFESLLAKSQFTNINGMQRLSFRLNPGHLGSLRIELTQQDAMMVAKIITSTQNAKEAIDQHVGQLKQALQSQNIQVDRIEVSTQPQDEQNFNRDGGKQQQQQQHQEKQGKKEDHNRIEAEYRSSFAQWLLNTEEVETPNG